MNRLLPKIQKAAYGFKRLFPSYLLFFVPFLAFGELSDIRLMLWKTAVVGAGLIIFHFVRKSMFPYIDLKRSYDSALDSRDAEEAVKTGITALAQSLLVGLLGAAIIFSMAGGL